MLPNSGWIDSFLLAAAMAACRCPRSYRGRAIAGFAIFDSLASRAALPFDVPAAVAVVLAFALAFAMIRAGMVRPVFYLIVPVLACVDNLFITADFMSGNDEFRFLPGLAEGIASGIAALAGFFVWDAIIAHRRGTKGELA